MIGSVRIAHISSDLRGDADGGPLQYLVLKTGLLSRGVVPRLWHRAMAGALGLRIHVRGKMTTDRPLLIASDHISWTTSWSSAHSPLFSSPDRSRRMAFHQHDFAVATNRLRGSPPQGIGRRASRLPDGWQATTRSCCLRKARPATGTICCRSKAR
jgi:hypothetical protein